MIINHLKIEVLDRDIWGSWVKCKAYESDTQAKDRYISNVLKEFLASHVEARVEDDRWQEEIKEEVLLELIDLSTFGIKGKPKEESDNHTKNYSQTSLMAAFPLVLFVSSRWHEEK